jgi:hypothetical protein
MYEKFWTKC